MTKTSGTILLCLLLAVSLSAQDATTNRPEVQAGGIIRTDRTKREIHLVFTGDEFGDGGDIIRGVLKKQRVRASFFLTGNFYRNKEFFQLITSLKKDGHYLGAHSDKHLLYCTWERRDSLLVTRDSFQTDLLTCYKELRRFGVGRSDARFFLPPYEWYNDSISKWTKELGLVLVNFTPGTYSNADYTYPEMGRQYLSSDSIFARILRFESAHSDGLNGFLLLTHIGTDPRRKDKFYSRLDELITILKQRGYAFTTLDTAIQ